MTQVLCVETCVAAIVDLAHSISTLYLYTSMNIGRDSYRGHVLPPGKGASDTVPNRGLFHCREKKMEAFTFNLNL